MKQFFASLMILFLAVSGYHLTFRSLKVPLFARKFYLTGMEYLFIGLFIGPQFLNILDSKTCEGLAPVNAFALGWVGLLFGFQFEIKQLRRYPIHYYLAAALESTVTFILVFGVSYIPIALTFGGHTLGGLITALVIAAVAACTAQTGLAMVAPQIESRHKRLTLFLRFISSIDGLTAILILGLVFSIRPLAIAAQSQSILSQSVNLSAIFLLCIGLLFLFGLFLAGRMGENEMVLVVIAMVVITSGAASMLNFSPLLTNAFLGVCLVNLARNKEQIFHLLAGIEKPIYLLVLIFLGVNWQIDSVWVILAAAGYAGFRAAGKISGGFAVRFLGKDLKSFPKLLGLGLLSPGGLPLVILLDFQQGFSELEISGILSAVLLGIVITDILSPHVLGPVIRMEP